MNMNDVTAFVQEHPRELAVGVGGLVLGYVVFGRKQSATEGENEFVEPPELSNDGITPYPTTPTNPGGISVGPTPPPTTNTRTPNPGPVPRDVAKFFICPDGSYRVWGRDNFANTVMCRSKASKKDFPAMRRKSSLQK